MQQTLGRPPKELIGPPFPDRYAHVWDMFLRIHEGRSYGMDGPNPLSWPDIKAWDDLMRADLQEGEVRAIKVLDLLWIRAMNEGGNNG